MIGIEVRLRDTASSVEDAGNHGLAKPFCVAGLPVRTCVTVTEVCDQKTAVSNLVSHAGVDESGLRSIVKAQQLKAGFFHRWSEVLVHDVIKDGLIEFHSYESIVARWCRTIELFKTFKPSIRKAHWPSRIGTKTLVNQTLLGHAFKQ